MTGYDVIIEGFRLNASEPPARALERVLGLPSDEAKVVAKRFPYIAACDVSADDAELLRAKLFEVGARSLVRPHRSDAQNAASDEASADEADGSNAASSSTPPFVELPLFASSPPAAKDGLSAFEKAEQAEFSYGLGELNIVATATQVALPSSDEAWLALATETQGSGGGRLLGDAFAREGSAIVELDNTATSAASPATPEPHERSTQRALGGAPRRAADSASEPNDNRWGLLVALPLLVSGLAQDDSLFLGNASALAIVRDLSGLYAAYSGLLGYSLRSVRVLSVLMSAITALTTWFAMPYVLATTARAPVTPLDVPLGVLALQDERVACSFHVFRAPKARLGLSSNAVVLRSEQDGPFFIALEGRFSDRELGWRERSPDPGFLRERIIGLDWILNKGIDTSYFQIVDERPAGITHVAMSIDRVKDANKKSDKKSAVSVYHVDATFILQLGKRRTQELHYAGPMAVVDEH